MIWPKDDDGIIEQIVLVREGSAYTNDPNDRGGPTRWGVTIPALSAFRGQTVTAADVEALQRTEAHALYLRKYIQEPGFDKIASVELRTALVDMAVLFGQFGAIKNVELAAYAIERIAGRPVDMHISDDDAKIINAGEPRGLINALSVRRVSHHDDVVVADHTQIKYLRGWNLRALGFIQ